MRNPIYVIVRASQAGRLYFCGDPPDKPGWTLPVAGAVETEPVEDEPENSR